MIQQINFYKEIVRKRSIPLSFSTMKNFVYGLCFFMLSVTVILMIMQYMSERSLKKLEDKQQQMTSKLQSKSSEMIPKESRDQIMAELKDVEDLYEKNQKILKDLTSMENKGSSGFSSYLLDLAHTVPKGLWLTKMKFIQGGAQFSLDGKTIQPELLTTFISHLHDTDSFSGKTLNVVDLETNESDPFLSFKIETEKSLGKKE